MPTATLDELILAVRAEIGDSTNVAMGLDALPAFRQLLKRVQEVYYLDYDWPNLIFNPEEPLTANERYYTFDNGVNFERIFKVWVLDAGQWREMEYGIDPGHYNISNPELGQTEAVPRRWCHYGDNQFEVWPMPSADTKIKFRCIRALPRLSAGTDSCLIDSTLLILAAAAEMLAKQKSADAQLKLSMATNHFNRLKGRFQKNRMFVMGGSPMKQTGSQIRVPC